MALIVCFLIVFPFLVDGYVLLTIECTDDNPTECLEFRKVYYFKGVIFNSSLTALMIAFIMFSMYKSRKDSIRHESKEGKTEQKLIYQALISSLFQLLYFILNYFSALTENEEKRLVLIYSSDIVYHLQHIGVMCIHFICSPTFLIEFLNFYFLTNLYQLIFKKKLTSKVSDVSHHTHDDVQTF